MADNIRLHVFDCGSMLALRHLIIQDEEALADKELRIKLPVQAFLIEHPEEGLILFDTACDPEGQDGRWSETRSETTQYMVDNGMYLPQRIEEAGFRIEDIKTVVISHIHVDHAGCLKYFPHARVYVQEAEYRETMNNYRNGLPLGGIELSDLQQIEEAGIQWFLVPEDQEFTRLAKGVTIVNFGQGHCYGLLGLLVELENSGNYMFTSDGLYLQKNMGPPRCLPPDLPGLCYDRQGYLKTIDKIEEYGRRFNAEVIYGHDYEQYQELVKKATPWLD